MDDSYRAASPPISGFECHVEKPEKIKKREEKKKKEKENKKKKKRKKKKLLNLGGMKEKNNPLAKQAVICMCL